MARCFDRRTSGDEMLAHRRARRLGEDVFSVIGRDGASRYEVHLSANGEASCDCPAGRFGRTCWHQAAAAREVLDQQRRSAPPVVVVLRGGMAEPGEPRLEVVPGGLMEEDQGWT